MADNKTIPTDLNVQAFLNAYTDEVRRTDANALTKLMRKVTGKEPAMWGPSIVGFDSYHYRYESGREGDMPIVGFSPRKAANVLYGALEVEGADALLAQLGRHTTGKGCLYIKKLADIDMTVLETLLRNAVTAKREQRSQQS